MINDRIVYLIKTLGISTNRFSENIGVSTVTVHNIIKARRSKPGFEVIQKILNTYPDLSTDWLLLGSGEMWKKERFNFLIPSAKELEDRVSHLTQSLKKGLADREEVDQQLEELSNLVGLMINENNQQKAKMIRLYERQGQIIHGLKQKLKLFN